MLAQMLTVLVDGILPLIQVDLAAPRAGSCPQVPVILKAKDGGLDGAAPTWQVALGDV